MSVTAWVSMNTVGRTTEKSNPLRSRWRSTRCLISQKWAFGLFHRDRHQQHVAVSPLRAAASMIRWLPASYINVLRRVDRVLTRIRSRRGLGQELAN